MHRRPPTLRSILLVALAVPTVSAAQQAPQFSADVSQTGDTPFTGTMYFGENKFRIEGVSDGEPVTMIVDRTAGRMLMLMAEERTYVVMDLGSNPFSAPQVSTMDPANPCASGELTACENLGTESVNGRTSRKWAYTRDGERETVWIATDLRFPVRIDAEGDITDFTNVVTGTQPDALFEPPDGYTAMDMPGFGGFGGGAGRAGPPGGRGRGQVPPGATGRGVAARGAAQPGAVPAGVDPAAAAQLTAQLQAMGLPPDQIAMALGQLAAAGTETNSAPWESGDGWIVDLVVTASHRDSGSREETSWTTTYSARFTASVPFTYGTPAVGAAMGPSWQLIPGLGSSLGEAQRITFSGTSDYRYESTTPQACGSFGWDGSRTVTVAHATGSSDTNDQAAMMLAQALWKISGDLSTHSIQAGARADETSETSESTTTITERCPGSDAQNSTEQGTRTPSMAIMVNLTDLPLPASPGVMRGTATQTMNFDVGGGMIELPANVEWTLRPIS